MIQTDLQEKLDQKFENVTENQLQLSELQKKVQDLIEIINSKDEEIEKLKKVGNSKEELEEKIGKKDEDIARLYLLFQTLEEKTGELEVVSNTILKRNEDI